MAAPMTSAPKVGEPVTKAAVATAVVNAVVVFLVGFLADVGLELDAVGTAMLILAVTGVVNFVLAGLLWGLGRLSELVPWRTVRDRVSPIPTLDPDFVGVHHDEPQPLPEGFTEPELDE